MQSVVGFMAESQAVKDRNKAKEDAWVRANKEYDVNANLEDVRYANNVIENDIHNDQIYQAMLNQWQEDDIQLDKIFAQGDRKIEKAIVEMYENEYAGTQTGRTAGRLAAKSARKMGFEKSRVLSEMMMEKRQTMVADERAENKAKWD